MSATADMAIVQRLLANTTVSGYVSTRVYPQIVPQNTDANTLPYIVYQTVDEVHEHYMNGASGVCWARVQLDIYSQSYNEVKAIAEAVRIALGKWCLGDVTVGTDIVRIFHCTLDLSQDFFDPPIDGSQRGRRRVSQDWKVCYEEPTFAFSKG